MHATVAPSTPKVRAMPGVCDDGDLAFETGGGFGGGVLHGFVVLWNIKRRGR